MKNMLFAFLFLAPLFAHATYNPTDSVINQENCLAMAQIDIHRCHNKECIAVITSQQQAPCETNDCKALTTGDITKCSSIDCQAFLRRDSVSCQTKFCTAVMTGNIKFCDPNYGPK